MNEVRKTTHTNAYLKNNRNSRILEHFDCDSFRDFHNKNIFIDWWPQRNGLNEKAREV